MKSLVSLSKTLLLNGKALFHKPNIAFEWKSLVLLSKTLLFRETQENLQNTKKKKKKNQIEFGWSWGVAMAFY